MARLNHSLLLASPLAAIQPRCSAQLFTAGLFPLASRYERLLLINALIIAADSSASMKEEYFQCDSVINEELPK